MTGRGRYKAKEWAEFESCLSESTGKIEKQKCKHCSTKISSKIETLREHLKKCKAYVDKCSAGSSSDELEIAAAESNDGDMETDNFAASTSKENASFYSCFTSTPSRKTHGKRSASVLSDESHETDCSNTSMTSTKKTILQSIDRFVHKTSKAEKEQLVLQCARAFYACNIPFNVAENEHMKKFISMLRGGTYTNPSRKQLGTHLLDKVYDECQQTLAAQLADQDVVLIQDGWSNVHNHPIIGSCLHTGNKAHFIRSIDSGTNKKTAEYCADVAEKEINFCESTYGCRVIGFCSDSEAKMVLTRKKLLERFQAKDASEGGRQLFVYGCAAHYLNLVETEVTPRTVLNKVVEVQKYFRNHHQPAAWLQEKGGHKPQLPNSTRWNSQDDCINTFLTNYQKLHEICSEHPDEVDKNIKVIMNNASIHMETMHLQKQLKIVSKALDTLQSDHCTLGDAVHVWLEMMDSQVLHPYREVINKRYKQCVTPLHLVAYQAHPKYKGAKLSNEQDEQANEWIQGINPEFAVPLMALSINDADTYPKSMLEESITNALPASKWWKILEKKNNKQGQVGNKLITSDFCKFMQKISSLPASSASVERLFSTFGLVHTKLRNRLGNTTTEKLVMCHSPQDTEKF